MNRSLYHLQRVELDDLRRFLALDEPENERLAYTQELTDDVVNTIAAMANTNGGIILIGVEERKENGKQTRRPGQILGIPKQDVDRLINKCYSFLDPPRFVPEILEVNLEETDKIVALIRIHFEKVPVRPIIARKDRLGKVYVRYEDRDREADPIRLRQLFSEPIPQVTRRPYPTFLLGMDDYQSRDNVTLVFQFAYKEMSQSTDKIWTSEDRSTIRDWLKSSPLCQWMDPLLLNTNRYAWDLTKSQAGMLQLEYRPPWPTPIYATTALSVSGVVRLDVVFETLATLPAPLPDMSLQRMQTYRFRGNERMRWDEAYQLTLAGLATVTHPDLLEWFPSPGWSPSLRIEVFAPNGTLDQRITIPTKWNRIGNVRSSQDLWEEPSEVEGFEELNMIVQHFWKHHWFNLGFIDFEADLNQQKPDRTIREAYDNRRISQVEGEQGSLAE